MKELGISADGSFLGIVDYSTCAFVRILILGVDGKLLVPVNAYRAIGRKARAYYFVGGYGGVAADGL